MVRRSGGRLLLAAVVGVLGLVATLAAALPAGSAPVDRLPDLDMARLTDLRVETTSDGRKRLRYTAVVVNIGSGPFELRATRPDTTSSSWTPVQRIYDSEGGFRDVPAPSSQFVFAANPPEFGGGDGHNHWHVLDLETADLYRLDNGHDVGSLAKHGFCVYDNVAYRTSLAGAPASVVYRGSGCGTPTSTTLVMGLSVGWGDRYGAGLPYQWIDITGLPNGRYRLHARVLASQLGLAQSNATNDDTWLNFTLQGSKIKNQSAGGVA